MNRRGHLALAFALTALVASFTVPSALAAPKIRLIASGETGPVRSMHVPTFAAPSSRHVVPRGSAPFRATGLVDGSDPVVQTRAGAPHMPASVSFNGINQTQNAALLGFHVNPPDTDGDVSALYYVQIVNGTFKVWNKDGSVKMATKPIHAIFSTLTNSVTTSLCKTHDDGDPVVLYDELADRWMISQFAFGNNATAPFRQCVAVSQTNDPSGAWNAYEYSVGGQFADYPKFGVWPDAYYMSANRYNSSFAFTGTLMIAFDRTGMIAGSATPKAPIARVPTYAGSAANVFATLPADLDGTTPPPAGARNPYVMPWDNGSTDKIVLFNYHIDWVTRTNSNVTTTTLASAAFNQNLCNTGATFACLAEPSPGEKLDSLAGLTMFRNAYRVIGTLPHLVFNFTVNAGSGRAGIRWYELTKPSTGWKIRQQGTYAPAGLHRWVGSIAEDKQGNIALGYSATSSTVKPGIRYTGRLTTDALSTLPRAEAVMQAGGGVQTDGFNRWGDYSDMSVDPADGCTFWYTNEYYAATSADGWSTRIGHFKFPACS